MIRFIDLFSGTGGIRIALENTLKKLGMDYECVKSAEIDKKACETYRLNFQEDSFEDVTQLEKVQPFDILLAGFPCQAFSYAGKQLGFGDTRGTLFFEVERLIAKYQPKLCVLENVRGLTTHDHGRTFKTIIGRLESLGYSTAYRLLNSSNYGVPQNRVRVYIIATKDGLDGLTLPSDVGADNSHNFKLYSQNPDLFSRYKHTILEDILEKNPDKKYDCSPEYVARLTKATHGDLSKLHGVRLIDTRHGNSMHSWDLGIKGECSAEEISFLNLLVSNRRRHIFGTHQDGKALTLEQIKTFYNEKGLNSLIKGLLTKGYLKQEGDKFNLVCGNMSFEVFKFLDPKSISITLTASDSNRLGVFYNNRVRRLTPRECARLQGYPEDYVLHPVDSVAYKQFGNAVSVPVVQTLLEDYFENNQSSLLRSANKSGQKVVKKSNERKLAA